MFSASKYKIKIVIFASNDIFLFMLYYTNINRTKKKLVIGLPGIPTFYKYYYQKCQ